MKISATIATYNEEKNLERCLKSLSFADEIIIVDSNSTDKTIKIAKKYTNKLFFLKFSNFSAIKNFAISKAKCEWILSIDADEEVSSALKDGIVKVVNDANAADGYEIRRETIFLGRLIRHCGWGKDYQIRLFKKSMGAFNGRMVHESVEITGGIKKIEEPIIHYSYPDSYAYFSKMNRYTSIQAKERQKGILILRMMFAPFFKFFRMYILKTGFLDGLQGFVLCMYSGFSEFVKFSKMLEKKKHAFSNEKIALRVPNWLGDAVIATAFLKEIKNKFKKLYIICDNSVCGVYQGNKFIDELIVFNRKSLWKSITTALSLRKEKIGIGISLTPSMSSGFMMQLAGIKVRSGFANDGFFLNRKFKRDKKHHKMHILGEYKEIFYNAYNEFDFSELKQRLDTDKKNEKQVIKQFNIKKTLCNIAIAPFVRFGPAKMWSINNYEQVISGLKKYKKNVRIFLIGTEEDKKQNFSWAFIKEIRDLRGKTSLKQVCALIKNMNLFIGNDSGIMHVADAFDIPIISIFTSTSYKWTGPLSKKAHVLSSSIDCAPCFNKKCRFGHYKCLEEINPQNVLEVAMNII